MQIELKITDGQEEWNSLLERCPQKTIFHTWQWLRIVEKYTKTRLYPLVGLAGTTPIGVYPVFHQRKGRANLVYSPPPGAGLLYLGPLILNYDELKQDKKESALVGLHRAVEGYISSKIKVDYVRIRTAPNLIDARFLRWNGYTVEPFHTYVVDMRDGLDSVWSNYDSQVRKDIKKTEREGITIEEGSKDDLDKICGYLNKEYLLDIYDAYHPTSARLFLAKHQGEYLGGQMTLFFRDKALLWLGASKTEREGVYPNDLLQWEMMKLAYGNGCRYYEIMCAGDDPSLRHSKSKFNPELSIWYSGERYSSVSYRIIEKLCKKTERM